MTPTPRARRRDRAAVRTMIAATAAGPGAAVPLRTVTRDSDSLTVKRDSGDSRTGGRSRWRRPPAAAR